MLSGETYSAITHIKYEIICKFQLLVLTPYSLKRGSLRVLFWDFLFGLAPKDDTDDVRISINKE